MRLAKVQLFGKQNRGIIIDPDATQGAVFGKNLIWPSGALVKASDFVSTVAGGAIGSVNGVAVTVWELIQNIPAFIQSLAGLTGVGLVARVTAGTAAVRTIEGETGRIVVTDGDGDAGNPAVALGPFPTVQNSIGVGVTATVPTGHQMIVWDTFVFDGGILTLDGDLIVIGV